MGILLVAASLFATELSFAQEKTAAPQTPVPAANPVLKLNDATPVLLRTKQSISSANAKVGARIPFRVTTDVKVGDLIVIHRGAEAWGVVTAVQPKARKGRAGSFQVAIQTVQLLIGDSAPLRAEEHAKGASQSGQMKQDMAELAVKTAGLGLPFLPLLMLEKGQDAYLPANTKITAYLNGDLPLDQTALERAQPPVVHRTGPATITIFRKDTGGGYHPDVYCGKIALGWLSRARYMKIQLPPGRYYFNSNDRQIFELPVQEGQEVYLELHGVAHGFRVSWQFTQASNEEGEDEVANLQEVNPKNVVRISSVSLTDLQAMPDKK